MIDRVDEFWPIVYPVAVGGGVPFFPEGARLNLKLVETKRFDSGPVLLRYQRAQIAQAPTVMTIARG